MIPFIIVMPRATSFASVSGGAFVSGASLSCEFAGGASLSEAIEPVSNKVKHISTLLISLQSIQVKPCMNKCIGNEIGTNQNERQKRKLSELNEIYMAMVKRPHGLKNKVGFPKFRP